MTRSRARAFGALYLLYFATVVSAALLGPRMPAAYEIAANLAANASYVAVTLVLYRLSRPVNPKVAVLALIISLVGCGVQSLSLFHFTSARSALPIFGLFDISIGYLIFRSTFMPRALGALMTLSGAGWLLLLSPSLSPTVLA